jgi:integrase
MALTELEFVEKMKAGTATVEEAISFAKSRPTTSDNAKRRIGALTSGFKKMGLDISMPYKDLKDDKVLKLFTKESSPDKSNRAPNLQALENSIKGLFGKYAISGVMEKVPGSDLEIAMYPQLTGTGTVAGTQRTGMAGERPMRGLLPMEDFAKMYAEAVPLIQKEYGQATADLIKYHATTFNRPSQLQGLKKSDVTVSGNTITVAGKNVTKTDKKGRPTLTYDLDSPTGQLLKRNLDSSKSEFLFDTTTANFDDAFAKHITPRLEPFSNVLPLAEIKVEGPDGIQLSEKPVTTPSAIRSIGPKIMLDQYNVADGLVQGMMGHVNDSILRKNYAGLAPATDIPKLLENPSNFAVGKFGTTEKNIDLDLLSDEDKAALIEDQKKTIQAEEQARQATARTTVAEAEAAEIKAKASISPEDIAKAEQVDEELIRAKTRKKIKEREIAADERGRAKIDPVKQDPMAAMTPEGIEKLKELGIWEKLSAAIPGPVKKALGPLGIGLSAVAAQSTYSKVSEAATKAGVPEPLAQTAGALAGASEFAPITFSDVEAVAEARVAPDMYGMTGASRVAADLELRDDVNDEGRPIGSTTSLRDVEAALQLNRKPKAVPEVNQSFLDMQP